eukprot:gene11283-9820_t
MWAKHVKGLLRKDAQVSLGYWKTSVMCDLVIPIFFA